MLMASVAFPLSGALTDGRAEEDRRVFADALFSRGMNKLAATEYAKLLEDFPSGRDRDLLYFRLGESLRLSGNPSEAAKAYTKVAQMKDAPFRQRALFKRAAIFIEMNQPDASAELFAELLQEKMPDEIRELSLYYYGEALAKSEQNAEAIKQFEELVKTYPKSEMAAFAKLSLGRLYAVPGAQANLARSKQLLNELSETPPTPRLGAEALFLVARAEFSAKNFKEAADAFRRLESTYPQDVRVAESRLQAAWAYSNAGFYDNAIKSCDAALNVANTSLPRSERVEYLYIRACCAFQLLRYDEAVKGYRETVAADPQSPFAAKSQYQVALSAYRLAHYDEAMSALNPILSDKSLRQDALWLMAEAAAGKNDSDQSVQYYKMLVSEYPDSPYTPDALYRLGHQLQLRKAWGDASVFFLQLVERFPGSPLAPRALFSSASSLSSGLQGAKALRDWEEYLKRFPNDEGVPEALFQKALEEIRVARKNEALQTLDTLLQRFPKTTRLPDAQFWRGQLLREKGSVKDAEQAFRQVLDSKPSDDVLRETKFSLAMVLQQDGRENDAAEIFQGLINDPIRAKFTPQQFAWLSEHQFNKNDFVNAEKTARFLTDPSVKEDWRQVGWTLVGRACRARQMKTEAETAFRHAAEIALPTRYGAESTLRLAELLLDRKNPDEAQKFFSLAVERCAPEELQGMRIYAYTGLGRAALAAGKQDEAAKFLMTVCLLYRDEQLIPPVMVETITLLTSLGRAEDADTLRHELCTLYPKSSEAVAIAKQAGEGAH